MTSKNLHLSNLQLELTQRIAALKIPSSEPLTRYQRGLAIYQNNLLMTAVRALSIAYPVITKMLGEQAIKVLAKRTLQMSMPGRGDWAEWGASLATELHQSELIETLPFLPDMAKLEWIAHQTKREELLQQRRDSLLLIQQGYLEDLYFELQAGVIVMKSEFPVADLWRAHRPWDAHFFPETQDLLRLLKINVSPAYCLIHQYRQRARIKTISEYEYQWYTGIQSGLSLAELITKYVYFDVVGWLENAVENNLLQQIKHLPH